MLPPELQAKLTYENTDQALKLLRENVRLSYWIHDLLAAQQEYRLLGRSRFVWTGHAIDRDGVVSDASGGFSRPMGRIDLGRMPGVPESLVTRVWREMAKLDWAFMFPLARNIEYCVATEGWRSINWIGPRSAELLQDWCIQLRELVE